MRFIYEPEPNSGCFNMAADEYIANLVSTDLNSAVLRIYHWDPTAISLGVNQSHDSISLNECGKQGWDVVRRPTGGRTLLHMDDISFAFAIKRGRDKFEDLKRVYIGIAEAISKSLRSFGIDAGSDSKPEKKSFDKKIHSARLCLTSRVRGEVHVGGKKIVAASQRVFRDSILQHGSIVLKGDPGVIANVLNMDESARLQISNKIREESDSIENITKKAIDKEQLVGKIAENIAETLECKLHPDEWREKEIATINASKSKFQVFVSEIGNKDE